MEILLYIIVGLFALLVLKSIKHNTNNIVKFQIKNEKRDKYENTKYKLISIDNKYLLKSWKPHIKDVCNIVNIFKKDNKEILCKNGLSGILVDPCREWVVIRIRDKNTYECTEYPLVVDNYKDELSPFETLNILKQLYKNYYGGEYNADVVSSILCDIKDGE